MNHEDHCVIHLTTRATAAYGARQSGDLLAPGHHVHVVPHALGHDLPTGAAMFRALAHFRAVCANRSWVFLGDDDTLFVDAHVARFAAARRRAAENGALVSYGNLHNVHRHPHSWFTGGAGIVLSRALVARLLDAPHPERWYAVALHCACFDVPLARAITAVGGRLVHRPSYFLDACIDCATHTAKEDVLACHAVSVYRAVNPHALFKRARDDALLDVTAARSYEQRYRHMRRHHPSELLRWCLP